MIEKRVDPEYILKAIFMPMGALPGMKVSWERMGYASGRAPKLAGFQIQPNLGSMYLLIRIIVNLHPIAGKKLLINIKKAENWARVHFIPNLNTHDA
jgi:hypothetical protein